MLAADLNPLTELTAQIGASEAEFARVLPVRHFATLTTTAGWGLVSAGNYAEPRVTRDAGPGLRRSTGHQGSLRFSTSPRVNGATDPSAEGSVALRRDLVDLGMGLWISDAPGRAYAAGLKARGKHGGVITCAMAHRAGRIVYTMVQARYDPARWK